MSPESSAADEFSAIREVHKLLAPLSLEARSRVINYLVNLLEIDVLGSRARSETVQEHNGELASDTAPPRHDTFAELFDAVAAQTNADKALVAGYWLQHHEGYDGFDSQSANALLKNLGYGLANVTAALTSLKEQKPALVLQLKKSGTSQQARKTYKVTVAGAKAIQDMIVQGAEA